MAEEISSNCMSTKLVIVSLKSTYKETVGRDKVYSVSRPDGKDEMEEIDDDDSLGDSPVKIRKTRGFLPNECGRLSNHTQGVATRK